MKQSFTRVIGLFVLPIIIMGAIKLSSQQGSIQGSASSSNGERFAVIATEFEIAISSVKNGSRTVDVSIPVKSITTENWMRDVHMKMSIFNKKFPQVEFSSSTAAEIKSGSLQLDGIMTINGIQLPHTLNLSLDDLGQEFSVKGETKVSLEAYQIASPGMGPMEVNDLVQMTFDLRIPSSDLQ